MGFKRSTTGADANLPLIGLGRAGLSPVEFAKALPEALMVEAFTPRELLSLAVLRRMSPSTSAFIAFVASWMGAVDCRDEPGVAGPGDAKDFLRAIS